MAWALLPVKARATAKGRLRGALSDKDRAGLAAAMRRDVAAALRGTAALQGVLLLSPDATLRRWGAEQGFETLDDGGVGLNEALALGLEALHQRGAGRALIIPSDVPLLSPEDLTTLLGAPAEVAIASDQRSDGTNGLSVPLGRGFTPHFGLGSAQAHRREARHRGLACQVMLCPGLALDIDQPDDLTTLLQAPAHGPWGQESLTFLYENHLGPRLTPRAAV
jgi:2-phospho-L-lactate guanylyltransferase